MRKMMRKMMRKIYVMRKIMVLTKGVLGSHVLRVYDYLLSLFIRSKCLTKRDQIIYRVRRSLHPSLADKSLIVKTSSF